MEDVTNVALDQLYGERATIEERFPDLQGSLRYEAIEKAYMPKYNHLFRFFGPDGTTKLLRRHPLNNRQQLSVVKQYTRRVLEEGVLTVMRGRMMAAPDSSSEAFGDGACLLFAAATLTEAVYAAAEIMPDNKHVQKICRDGMEGLQASALRSPFQVAPAHQTAHCLRFPKAPSSYRV